MDNLTELAERCEQATGPDRQLEIEIIIAIDWRDPEWEEGERTAREMAERHGLAWLVSRSVEGFSSYWRHLPRFTASLDAAMTLVPEGWEPLIDGVNSNGERSAAWIVELYSGASLKHGAARTPALALCAAALRARTQNTPDSQREE